MRHPPLHRPRTAVLLALLVTLAVAADPVAAATRYVDLASPSPALPFLTWATAATNIQAAIDGAAMGDTILVAPGVYTSAGPREEVLYIAHDVRVQSVNGPAVTVIDALGQKRCAVMEGNAVLDGFTLRNGYVRFNGPQGIGRGGGAFCHLEARLTNCVIEGGNAFQGGGVAGGRLFHCVISTNRASDGGGVFQSAVEDSVFIGNSSVSDGAGACLSQLHRCIVRNNFAGNNGGGAAYATLVNCLVTGNYAIGGGGAERCALVHCTVTGNSAGFAGGGTEQCQATNCIVYFNSALEGNNYPDFVSGDAFLRSCTTPLPPGGNANMTNAPLFVNAAAGDYCLRPGSPCIDAGADFSAWVTSDLNGLRRPLDGNRDGVAGFDLGAFEFNPLFFTSITRNDHLVRFEWFDTLPGMQLQATESLQNPVWNVRLTFPFGGTNAAELPLDPATRYFRLTLP